MDENTFYNEKYDSNKVLKNSPNNFSIIYTIFVKLRKFEHYRDDIIYDLLPKGNSYLDIGCGTGSLLAKAKNKFTELYGCDIVEQRFIASEGNQNIHFKVANINNGLPYENRFFDAVTCEAVLEHIFDPYFILEEINRVLKDDGILILDVPNIAWLPHRLSLLFGRLPLTGTPFNSREHGWDGGHLHYFTMSQLTQLIEYSGFEIVDKKCSGIFAEYRNWWINLLGGDLIIKCKKLKIS